MAASESIDRRLLIVTPDCCKNRDFCNDHPLDSRHLSCKNPPLCNQSEFADDHG